LTVNLKQTEANSHWYPWPMSRIEQRIHTRLSLSFLGIGRSL